MSVPHEHLYFIRSKMAFVTDFYYESVTDVWVFGDVKGYKYFQGCLDRAKTAKSNLHLDAIDPDSNSMRVVILPAAKLEARQPRLKMIERLVFINGCPLMELVIFANDAGYDNLSDAFDGMITKGVDDTHDHTHVDCDDDWLAQRSVALNIRGPLSKWSRAGLWVHEGAVYDRLETFLPPESDFNYMDPEDCGYEEISADECSHLSLDVR